MKWLGTALVGMSATAVALAQGVATNAAPLGDPARLPPPAKQTVDFARDIRPIIAKHCVRCHSRDNPKGEYRIDNHEGAIAGGGNGAAIMPGDSARSPLIHYVARLVPEMEMPPDGKGEPLTAEKISLLRAWIDQGAVWSKENVLAVREPELEVTPTIRWLETSGDAARFREHHWQKGGWTGGLEEFRLYQADVDTELDIRAHALGGQEDYGVRFELKEYQLGFLRGGAETFRRYYDDSGGFFRDYNPQQYSLGRDLHLDSGRAWLDAGLVLPDWPRLTIGYEYQWRQGAKSLLQWGFVVDGFDGRNIAPASKDIDERVHVVKFAVDHTLDGWRLEDQFRGEFYDLQTARTNVTLLFPPDRSFDAGIVVRERHKSFTGANAFRAEKQLTDWLFASGGYLYSRHDADGAFALDGQPVFGLLEEWRSRQIVLEREAHVFNLNGVLGPWQGFTLALGAQGEWNRQQGMTGLDVRRITPFPGLATVTIDSDIDTERVQESALLRFTAIPFTTLFAEARLEQESLSQFEEQAGLGQLARDTDATTDGLDLRTGFSTSPWKSVTWSGHYRRIDRESDFNHLQDTDNGSAEGYGAFIRSRSTTSDAVETKLALRPASWLRATLSYKLEATDYRTATDPVAGASLGGGVQAGNYDARVYGANFVVTAIRNLFLSAAFTYQDIRTLTAQQGNASVVPYRGDIYSVIASASYALNSKTEIFASHAFSRAGFAQSNFADGLPLGIEFTQHTAQGGIVWRPKPQLRTRLGYGWFHYDEPTSGGLNDYTAHMVFTSVSYSIR